MKKLSLVLRCYKLYTGLVYKGPLVAKEIKKELIQILKSEGISNIQDAVGKGNS